MTIYQDPQTPNEALTKYREVANTPPETKAKAKLLDDLKASEKTYMDLAKTLSDYATKYAEFTSDDMLSKARGHRDKAKSTIDDPDETGESLKTTIKELHDQYTRRAWQIVESARKKTEDLEDTLSPLAAADAAVAKAQAALEHGATFSTRAAAWFADVETLGKAVLETAEEKNMRLAYAQYLELNDVYEGLILTHFGAGASKGSPDWLRGELNGLVLALMKVQFARYEKAETADARAAASKAASDLEKSFVTENGRRIAFFREAQDVVVQQKTATSGSATQTERKETAPA